jgi:hypothetical protein
MGIGRDGRTSASSDANNLGKKCKPHGADNVSTVAGGVKVYYCAKCGYAITVFDKPKICDTYKKWCCSEECYRLHSHDL